MTSPPQPVPDASALTRWLVASLAAGLAALLGWATLSLPDDSRGLASAALEQLPRSGVTNPVTAVFMNYRAYDTLLEIGVLLLAVLGVWAVAKAEPLRSDAAPNAVLLAAVRLLVPLMILIAGYLLWIGSFAPGGAFQGGAVLAGAALLWLLSGAPVRLNPSERDLRVALALGLTVFVAVAAGVMFAGANLLEYPQDSAGGWILFVESACVVSIGVTLAALFVGGRPADPRAATVAPLAAPTDDHGKSAPTL